MLTEVTCVYCVCVCMYVDASGVVLSNHKCRVCTYCRQGPFVCPYSLCLVVKIAAINV